MSEIYGPAGVGLKPGSRVGGYILEDLIGQGGMAVVFRAQDERLGRQVALKILAPAQAADDGFRQRFIRESRVAAAVDDPHIIPVFEAGEADGVLFIAMRYVRGGDVRSLLSRDGVMAPIRAAAIVAPIAGALDAAHMAGLVHRDVKPANMLLDMRPGRPAHVYLSDFGLSKKEVGSTKLTVTGQFFGTVDYVAPEQIDGRQVDGRADQYSLGCAAFEMLCGVTPFHRDLAIAVLVAHQSEPPPSLTSLRPGLPGNVDLVFSRVLAKSPDDRYRSCQEFSNALRTALDLQAYEAEGQTIHPSTVISTHKADQEVADTISRSMAEAECRIAELISQAQHHRDEILEEARKSAEEIRAAAQEEAAHVTTAARARSDRQSNQTGHAVLLIEIIMLRARTVALRRIFYQRRGDQWDKYQDADISIAQVLANDIARAQEAAGRTPLGRSLADTREIADRLVRKLRAGENRYYIRWRKVDPDSDRSPTDICDELKHSLLTITLDASGVDLSDLDLPPEFDRFRPEPLEGIVWTTDTVWPAGYRSNMKNISHALRQGVFQIQIDSKQ